MNPEAFDLQVAVEDPLREQYKAVSIGNPNILREISILDRKIAAVVQSVHATKLKLDFMRGFESDPVGFINKWVESQTRDLQVFYYWYKAVIGEYKVDNEQVDEDFFKRDHVKEALFHYLAQHSW